METMTPTAQFMIDHFFDEASAGLGRIALGRVRRAREHLTDFVEREGHRIMCEHQLTALALERELEPEGAAGRVLAPVDLIWLLSDYFVPANLLPDRVDASCQVRQCSRLLDVIVGCYEWGDIACGALEAGARLERWRAAQRMRG